MLGTAWTCQLHSFWRQSKEILIISNILITYHRRQHFVWKTWPQGPEDTSSLAVYKSRQMPQLIFILFKNFVSLLHKFTLFIYTKHSFSDHLELTLYVKNYASHCVISFSNLNMKFLGIYYKIFTFPLTFPSFVKKFISSQGMLENLKRSFMKKIDVRGKKKLSLSNIARKNIWKIL